MNIGDRVTITGYGYIENKNVKTRDKGTIIDIVEFRGMHTICVEIDRNIKGHNCGGKGKEGHCVWVSPRTLALDVKPVEVKKRIYE